MLAPFTRIVNRNLLYRNKLCAFNYALFSVIVIELEFFAVVKEDLFTYDKFLFLYGSTYVGFNTVNYPIAILANRNSRSNAILSASALRSTISFDSL